MLPSQKSNGLEIKFSLGLLQVSPLAITNSSRIILSVQFPKEPGSRRMKKEVVVVVEQKKKSKIILCSYSCSLLLPSVPTMWMWGKTYSSRGTRLREIEMRVTRFPTLRGESEREKEKEMKEKKKKKKKKNVFLCRPDREIRRRTQGS